MTVPWRTFLVLAGYGQLGLAVGSLVIPRVLRWPEDLARLRKLTRQVFWTYAGYIWATNLTFGLVSAFAPGWLLDGSPLAGAVSGYVAAYWGARVVIQFVYFDRAHTPKGLVFTLAEIVLVALFLFLTVVYVGLTARAFGWIGA